MRIFIGLHEIASFASTYAKGFRALGHETYTIVWTKNRFYPDVQYDIVVDEHLGFDQPNVGLLKKGVRRIKSKGFVWLQFLHALVSCDVFVFLFGTSFLPRYLDYPILRLFGKSIISVFLGSDIRHWYAFEQEMHLLGLGNEIGPLIECLKNRPGVSFLEKTRRVRAAERYADLILSQPGCGQLQTRPYMRANVPLDLSQFRFNVPEREVPLVLHIPSARGAKGTEYVLAAVEQLKREGIPFEFRLVENTPNAEVRELLAEADIVVDELLADTVGVLSLESMATGNAVLVRYPAEYARVPAGCPAVNVTKDTLVGKLREVILNRDLRRQLAYAGRPYVEAHNDHVQVTRQILDWLEPGGIQEYDFTPTFFHDNFVMSPELLREERKKMWKTRLQRIKDLVKSLWSPRLTY